MAGLDPLRLAALKDHLGEAALDPTLWSSILEEVAAEAGATGAMLLQSDVRTPDVPRTASMTDALKNYFEAGWHTRDLRARGVPMQMNGEIITDQDVVTPDEMRFSPYYGEMLEPYGFRWFAGVGFWAGNAMWCLSLQRTPREGAFEAADKPVLKQLSHTLGEVATLSAALGRASLLGVTNGLQIVQQAAIAVDRCGQVIATNARAEQLFDATVRVHLKRLQIADPTSRQRYGDRLDALRLSAERAASLPPLIVRRGSNHPLVFKFVSLPGVAQSPFLGARALILMSDLRARTKPHPALLSELFGLTPAEARLAAALSTGDSLERIAGQFGVSRETARNQLKSIFSKTETRRQAELVALLGRLGAG